MGMDHNLDLLKYDTHRPTEQFLDLMVDNEQWPTITRPTRITQRSATLIDSIFFSSKLHRNFNSMIILDDISDHLPTVALVKQTKLHGKTPIEFHSRDLSDTILTQIREKLNQVDWNGVLNSEDCERNFNTFCHIVETKLNEIAPLKMTRISGKWHFQEPWLTTGLEMASRTCRKLYRNTLMKNCTEETMSNYKNYRNVYDRLKRKVKIDYYNNKCMEYSNDTKLLWRFINQMICKVKNSRSIIPYITVDGLQTYQPKKIAHHFGKFYSSLGENLAASIPKGSKHINAYLQKMPKTLSSLVLQSANITEIERLILDLPNKTSYGHDKGSNIMLKKLAKSISYPLQIIFNQSISQGIFPEKMKLAEVILLYKGKEYDKVINYQPIS